MKYKLDQIEFLDTKLLPIYGFKEINDYSSKISEETLSKNDNFLDEINNIIPDFKKVFPVKDFSLHKTNNKIISIKHAMSFLKMCFNIAIVPFECTNIKGTRYLRLIPQNNILTDYIKDTKMSENRTLITGSDSTQEHAQIDTKNIKYDDITSSIKKKTLETIYVPFENCLKDNKLRISLHELSPLQQNISSIKVSFMSDFIKDEVYMQNLNGCPLTIYSSDKVLYKGKYLLDMNIVPYDMILFGPLMKYHGIYFELDDISFFDLIKNLIVIKIEYELVHFSALITKALDDINIIVEVPFVDNQTGLSNKLKYICGMLHIEHCEVVKKVYVLDIPGTECILDMGANKNIKYWNYAGNNGTDVEALKALICGYPLVKLQNEIPHFSLEYFTEEQGNIVIKFRLNAHYDAYDNICIFFDEELQIDNGDVKLFIENGTTSHEIKGNLFENYFKALCDSKYHINRLNSNKFPYLTIKIPESMHISKYGLQVNKIKIAVTPWFYDQKYRKKMASGDLVFKVSDILNDDTQTTTNG